MSVARLAAFSLVSTLVVLLVSAGPTAEIITPKEAIAAVIDAYRTDAEVRKSLEPIVGERIEGRAMKASKLPPQEFASWKERFSKMPDRRRNVIYQSPESIAAAEGAWRVRVQDLRADWRIMIYVDTRTRRVMRIASVPTPYL